MVESNDMDVFRRQFTRPFRTNSKVPEIVRAHHDKDIRHALTRQHHVRSFPRRSD
jgi:hypothetical protein